ncbi:Arabinose 5-phosphate isomerase KdsD [Halomonadaceae bacterium LMG 33818]|uniref:KpsF/GutQ family sugar-phosphate isomerase n=1 Tax=Cernens ardua TaxID=3402176 RepID=UPI003EDBE200
MNQPLDFDFCSSARQTLALERDTIDALIPRVDRAFTRACQLILQQTDDEFNGRVVVTGIGKSGHIARKLSATLASTGSPSFFLHPAEASHGDLGMITDKDVVLALSHSGETVEIAALLPMLKRKGVKIIAMTGNLYSTLAKHADVVLDVEVRKEACPLNLAPTASTTAALAMGDALAIALLEARGFNAQDFALSHPGGMLGRRLLLTVNDVMRKGDAIPRVSPEDSVRVTLFEITTKGLGFATIVDDRQHLLGLYTDGDLRRTLDRNLELDTTLIVDVMSHTPITVPPKMLAAEALRIMEQRRITALAVVDNEGRLVGALKLQDLLNRNVV